MNNKKHYHVEHIKNYQHVTFDKQNKDIINRIKKYGYRNCKKDIIRTWITESIKNFDIGFAYFNTEIIETKNNEGNIVTTEKYRPCAYLIIEKISNVKVHLSLLCSLSTTEHLGTKLLDMLFKYCNDNNYKTISLDSINAKTTRFYTNKGFIIKPSIKKLISTVHMEKNL